MIERDKEYYNQKISELYTVIENQEKIIRDLQEEVKGYQTMHFDKVMIINKAVEYIDYALPCIHDDELLEDLQKILKGENND